MRRLLLSMMMLGAAGLLKAQNSYPIIPIDTVQFVSSTKLTKTPPNDSSDYVNPIKKNAQYGDTVNIEGIVLMSPKLSALSTSFKAIYLQRKGPGGWAGVLVRCPSLALLPGTKLYDNAIPGYKVRVTGVIRQFNLTGFNFGETQIDMIANTPSNDNSVQQLSLTVDTIQPTVLTIDSFSTGNRNTAIVENKPVGEKYEGMYVEFRNVTVFYRAVNGAARWVWGVADANGNEMPIRDVSGWFRNEGNEDTSMHVPHTFSPPALGTKLSYIRGVIVEANSNSINSYWLAPLTPGDIGTSSYNNPIVTSLTKTPALVTATDSVFISAKTTKGSAAISAMRLYYTLGYSNTVFDSVAMIKNALPNDTTIWYGKIPTFAAGSIVKYWTKAIDANGFSTDYPNTNGNNSAYKVVNSNVNITIQELQQSVYASYGTLFNGDSLVGVNLRGVITGNAFTSSTQNFLTMQSGKGANSAILIQRGTGDPTSGWQVGDSVQITSGKVTETFNTTILNNVRGSVIQSGVTLPPFERGLPLDSFVTNKVTFARPWEGVMVRFDSVYVTNVNPDAPSNNGEWSIHTDTLKTGLRIDDMAPELRGLNAKIQKGMKLGFIQGPMWFSFSNFKMIPRKLTDMDLSRLDSVAPKITLLGNNPDTVKVGSGVYADAGATAMDNVDGNITAKIVKTGTVNTAVVGTYVLSYTVSDAWGLKDSTARRVIVKDTANVGVNENEMNFAQLNVYPNPATTAITVSGNFIKTQPITITLVDLLGKEISTRTVRGTQFNETISIDNLNSGVYFCTISNASGSKTLKFVVNGK